MKAPATTRTPWRRLGRGAVAGTASVAAGIGLLGTSAWLITRASMRPPLVTLSIAIGLVQVFALSRGIARYWQRLAVHDVALERQCAMRLELFDQVEPLVPGGLPGNGSGEMLTAFVSDTDVVAQSIAKSLTAGVDAGASIVLGGLVAAVIDPGAGLLLLATCVAVVAVAAISARLGDGAARREGAARAALAGVVIETVRAAPELVAFGREDLVQQRLEEVHKAEVSAGLGRAVAAGAGRASAIWLAGGGLLAVLGAALAANRAGDLRGVMVAVLAFVSLAALDPCTALPSLLADVASGEAARQRLASLQRLPVPAPEPAGGGAPPGPPGEGAFGDAPAAALEHVECHPGGTPVLRDASLALVSATRTGLTGPSGSGKTLAVSTLLHFIEPSAGRATVGGRDVRTMTRRDLAGHLGWMSDETYLFAATLRDNLRIAVPPGAEAGSRPGAEGPGAEGDQPYLHALTRAGLGPWLSGLPDGLDTVLGAGGRPVSAGECQRIGLARALLAGGQVLLLDEPTAHVDPASAGPLLEGLLAAAGERAVLVVSHEDALPGMVDTLLALEDGALTEQAHRPRDHGPHGRTQPRSCVVEQGASKEDQ